MFNCVDCGYQSDSFCGEVSGISQGAFTYYARCPACGSGKVTVTGPENAIAISLRKNGGYLLWPGSPGQKAGLFSQIKLSLKGAASRLQFSKLRKQEFPKESLVKCHLLEGLYTSLAETLGEADLSRYLRARMELRLTYMSDGELWQLARIVPGKSPEEAYRKYRETIAKIKPSASKLSEDIKKPSDQILPAWHRLQHAFPNLISMLECLPVKADSATRATDQDVTSILTDEDRAEGFSILDHDGKVEVLRWDKPIAWFSLSISAETMRAMLKLIRACEGAGQAQSGKIRVEG